MRVNLHMLVEDVADLGFESKLNDHWSVRPVRLAAYTDGSGPLKSDRAYVMEASTLRVALAYASGRVNAVCVGGRPPQAILDSGEHNIIWTEKPVSPAGLVERLNDRIAIYNDWKEEIDDLFAVNAPYRRIAEVTEDLFGNPIWMWDSQLQTVFHVMKKDRYRIPQSYQAYPEETPWPIEGINAINDTFRSALKNREPYVLPPMFGYESLCYNLFDNDIYSATLSVDQISGRPFTDRERCLIAYIGETMAGGLRYQSHFSRHATFTMSAQIEKLAAGGNVPRNRLAASLARKGWSIDDTYYCTIAKQRKGSSYSELLMIPLAESIIQEAGNTVSVLLDGSMLFITNFTLSNMHPSAFCPILTSHIDRTEMRMRIGVSTPFTDFTSLPHFRKQAEEAIVVGKKEHPQEQVFYFHDYIMEAIVRRCTHDTIPEVFYPPMLSRLKRYDKANGTDLVITLETYLENDLSTSKTAQKLFMHRNTLLSRLKKIEEVGQMDLEDNKTRLLLSLALAMEK